MIFLKPNVLRVFCNMLALWQWKRYRVTAHYMCYLSKDINLTLKENLQEYKRKFIYLSKTATIIIPSYILLKLLAVKHANPL